MSGQQAITTAVYVTEGGKCYHMDQACFVLGSYQAPSVHVVSLVKAQRARKKPCRYCVNSS